MRGERTKLPTSFALALIALAAACSDTAGGRTTGGDAGADGGELDRGVELRVAVPASGRVHVRLGVAPAIVTPASPSSADWDLAFEGFDVFSNGGSSGGGRGAAFGPLDAVTFLGDTAPQVPFLMPDKAGGAFLDWYAYEGSSHALFSRYHVYGIRDGDRRFKVQILGYYGQRDGASVAAIYGVRYAELTGSGSNEAKEVTVDGTAGGTSAPASAPSECLDLGTGQKTLLTPSAAAASLAWHLCFRRDAISVNGERGGPRNVGAIDLGAEQRGRETVDQVKLLTADSTRSTFDRVDVVSFAGKELRGDRVVSAFGDRWLDRTKSPLAPAYAAWLVLGANGTEKYLLGFASFVEPAATSPGTVVLKVKPVKG